MHEKETVATLCGKLYFADHYDAPRSIHHHEVSRVLADERSPYQHIQIFDTRKHGRVLVLDGFPQISERDGWLYTEAMILPALLAHPNPRRVLILGGGDGAAASFSAHDPRVQSITIVDLDKKVVELTQLHLFSLWENARRYSKKLDITVGDALAFLKRDLAQYDIIISDITDPNESESAAHLLGIEFFALISARLAPNGILAMQSGENAQNTKTAHQGFLNLVSKNFSRHLTSALYIPWFSAEWSFTFARNSEPLPDFADIFIAKRLFKQQRDLISSLQALTIGKLVAMFAATEPDSPLDPGYRSRTRFVNGANRIAPLLK
ncbi:hypothetical protein HYT04_02030 [Candidatus Kaiserbacteria bacterium]|nr:hypothetical protein [Candidatus Kaiserbacteria bacterium]